MSAGAAKDRTIAVAEVALKSAESAVRRLVGSFSKVSPAFRDIPEITS